MKTTINVGSKTLEFDDYEEQRRNQQGFKAPGC